MNIDEFIKSLFDGDEPYKVVSLNDLTLKERLTFILNNIEQFRFCNCCETLILDQYPLCPYCSSYNFSELTENFITELETTRDTKYVDYFIPLQ